MISQDMKNNITIFLITENDWIKSYILQEAKLYYYKSITFTIEVLP